MTIESAVNNGITYSGNDVATTFSFPFKVNTTAQIEVIVRDADDVETVKVLNTDYTVANQNVEGSGVITYPVSGDPLPTGYKITINPKMDYLQSTDIKNQGRFAPQSHEDAFDTLMMHIKQLKGIVDRALLFKKSSEITDGEFGDDPEDGSVIAWDGTTGRTKNVSPADLDVALISSFWQAVLLDTNLSDSLDQLGFSALGKTLTTLASTSEGRTALGVVIGTDVQAFHANLATLAGLASIANLTALAGLTGAANKIPYFTAEGAMDLVNSVASDSQAGLVELLTNAELAAGTDTERAATAAAIASLFGTSDRSSSGYMRLPVKVGGAFVEMIVQWGRNSVTTGTTISYPLTFPNAVRMALTNHQGVAFMSTASNAVSASQLTLYHNNGGTVSLNWLAIGY